MNKPLRHTHKSDTDNFYPDKDLLKHQITKEHFKEITNGKNIKKVLFINPPDVDESIFDYDIAKRGRANNYPSYGIGVLTSQLRKRNYNVDICNLNHETLKKVYYSKSEDEFDFVKTWHSILIDKINEFKPDLIGVSCLFSVTHNSFKKVCKFVKSNFKSTPLLVGGVHVSHDIYGVMNDLEGVDLVSLFEGDLALPTLLDVLNNKTEYYFFYL